MNKSIALVFPKSTFLIDPLVYPPLGLWYLAAQIEKLGHKTEFFDLSIDKLPDDGEFDQMWISATSAQMHEVRKISEIVKSWEKTVSIFGGPAPWANIRGCTDLSFDVVVGGEADHPNTIKEILNRTKLDSKKIIITSISKGNLDWVIPPIRRWDNKYHALLLDKKGNYHKTSTLFTSRGCPRSCAFCESGRNGVIWDKFIRYEPVEIVDLQIKEIIDHGHTGLMYYDDILPLNKKRTLEILNLHKKYNIVYRCFLRTDIIMKHGGFDYLKEMSDAGLVEVLAGVESADNRIKVNIEKGTTIEQDTQVLTWCKQLGIKFKASFILGLPGEDKISMEKTLDWILKYKPDRVDLNTLIPFPGTPLMNKPDNYDVYWTKDIPEEYFYKGNDAGMKSIVGTSKLYPDEISNFHKKAITEIRKEGIPY